MIDLSTQSASQGFIIQGDAALDNTGRSVASAGDVNGDGFADLIVGAVFGDDGGSDAGEAYVVFGKDPASGSFGTNVGGRQVIDLTTLTASQGFIIQGDAAGDVASAGDINGDGFDDLIVGALVGSAAGAYVLFGGPHLGGPDVTPLKTTAEIFDAQGGKSAFLGTLSLAAYHLVAGIENVADRVNDPKPGADGAYTDATNGLSNTGIRWLTTSDLATLSPVNTGTDSNFPSKGLIGDGIYVNGNAAALVGVSSDALFISFRGTNDNVGEEGFPRNTPDEDHWIGKGDHYALLLDLVAAIDAYVLSNGITKVFVTGHSLGAAMAQKYMMDHDALPDSSALTSYEAVTFATPGFGAAFDSDDARIANFRIEYDPILVGDLLTGVSGDQFIIDHQLINPLEFTSLHSVILYGQVADYLDGAIDLEYLYARYSSNGIHDDINILLNISKTVSDQFTVGARSGTMRGTDGMDVFIVEHGGTLVGYLGTDLVYFAAALTGNVVVDLQAGTATSVQFAPMKLKSIEDVIGSTGNDTIRGTAGANRLEGGIGNDLLEGRGGNDTVIGGTGNDYMIAGFGVDTIDGGEGMDTLSFGSLMDASGNPLGTMFVNLTNGKASVGANLGTMTLAGIETLLGSVGVDQFFGGTTAETMRGSLGDDTLSGRGGNDTLAGGVGRDTILGGADKDTMTGGADRDTFVFGIASHSDAVRANADLIADFNANSMDIIDLKGIGAMSFIGTSAFSASGQVRYEISGGNTYLEVNTGKSLGADMTIILTGAITFDLADFLLA